ncbi:hypothetical protein ACOME3_008209 [Neoechinorhynchus agilis]
MTHLKSVKFRNEVEDLCFFDFKNQLLSCSIDGCVEGFDFGVEQRAFIVRYSRYPIRRMTNVLNGNTVQFIGTSNGALKKIDVRQNRVVNKLKHRKSEINDVHVDPEDICNKLYSSFKTDDSNTQIMALKKHGNELLATCDDGILCSFNFKKRDKDASPNMSSEPLDSGLLCLEVVKQATKVVCATETGAIYFFNIGEWGNMCDRYPVIKDLSIDSILAISEDVICIGCEDGLVRLVHLHPNRVLGCLRSDIGTAESGPIQCLCKSADNSFLATGTMLDSVAQVFDISSVRNVEVDGHEKARKPGNIDARRREFTDFYVDLDGECSE